MTTSVPPGGTAIIGVAGVVVGAIEVANCVMVMVGFDFDGGGIGTLQSRGESETSPAGRQFAHRESEIIRGF
jgi:hypothetical protein